MYVGAPETVAGKIAATAKALGLARFDLKYSAGTLAHEKMMRCIELYGSKVVPLVRGDAWLGPHQPEARARGLGVGALGDAAGEPRQPARLDGRAHAFRH